MVHGNTRSFMPGVETPLDNSYVPKDRIVLAWSFQMVKCAQFKMLFVVKVETHEQHTWATMREWEVASVHALKDHVDIILENSYVQNVHMFMHQFSKPFDPIYAEESCVEPDVIKSETIFIDGNITNTKVASRFTKLKQAITVVNNAQQSKPRSQQPVMRKATTEEGAGSSRPQARGVHSIVKLNTTCENNKSTFYIKDHQNRSNFFHFFSRVDIHRIYYIIKNCNQI